MRERERLRRKELYTEKRGSHDHEQGQDPAVHGVPAGVVGEYGQPRGREGDGRGGKKQGV